jgi:PmbA protein
VTDLLDLASRVVSWASPGEQVEAFVSRARTTSVRAYEGQVESLSSAEPIGAGIRVISGGRQGFAWAGTLDEAILKETLQEARDNVPFAQPDEFNGLAEPDGVPAVELDLVSADLLAMPTTAKVELAIEVERAVRARDARVSGVEVASFGDRREELAVATTTGIAVAGTAGMCALSVAPLVSDGSDTQTGYGYVNGRGPADLDPDVAVDRAVTRAVRLLGGAKPASRRLTAVFDPEVTAAFLGIIGGTLSGDAVLKGRSLFAGREGEAVAAAAVTFTSDPTNADSADAEAYDGEGLARRRLPLIEGGRLLGFLYDTYSGRRSGKASTGAATRGYASAPAVGAPALSLVPGTVDPAELVARIDDGVYVQGVTGLHSGVNPVSGDFSVGAKGLLIRGGSLGQPFREATIASTLQRMLLDIAGIGSDLEWQPGGNAGVTLVIDGISLGGS